MRFHDLTTGKREWFDPETEQMAAVAREIQAQMVLTYLTSAVAANILNQIITTGLFMSIHSALPNNTGSSELVAGTAYTAVSGGRPPIAWGSITAGVVDSNDTQTYAMLTTEAGGIPGWGLWTANTAGTWLFGGPTTGLTGSIPSSANVVFPSSVALTAAG
jgi:hypothetical protein